MNSDPMARLEAGGFMAGKKRQSLIVIALLGLLVFVPYSIKNFYIGHLWLAVSQLACALVLAVDLLVYQRFKKLPINAHLGLMVLLLSMSLSIDRLGVYGLLWMFPIIIFMTFLMTPRQAIFYCCLFIVVTGLVALQALEFGIAVRYSVSMILTVAVTMVLLNNIYELQERLQQESIHDPLTGVFNRRQLSLNLADCIAQYQRNQLQSVALMIDIDHFKGVNDDFGHEQGDVVLRRVAELIKQSTREVDLLFRLGGEEFLLLLRGMDMVQALTVAQKLRHRIYATEIISQRRVSVSVGVCDIADAQCQDSWLRYTDVALYQAKNNGRNRVEIYQQAA